MPLRIAVVAAWRTQGEGASGSGSGRVGRREVRLGLGGPWSSGDRGRDGERCGKRATPRAVSWVPGWEGGGRMTHKVLAPHGWMGGSFVRGRGPWEEAWGEEGSRVWHSV